MTHKIQSFGRQGVKHGLFFDHRSVTHSAGEFVNGEDTTNSIESVWAVMKRGLHGVYGSIQLEASRLNSMLL